MEVLVIWEVWEVCWILKGFWLCQCFCWVMDPSYECEVLLLLSDIGCCCLSIIVKCLSCAIGCFVEMWWFLMALVIWFLWSETLSGACWFHLYIPLCSCWLDISSGRLCQFSVHLELDCLDAWVKTWWCWYLLRKLLTLYFAWACLYCSPRPLMYGMTTLAPSMNFPVDRFGFLLAFCWGLPCWKNCVW